jgi:hypothetical protein
MTKRILSALTITSLISLSSVYGEIKINDNLAVTGFIDMSASYTETDSSPSTHTDSFNLDQAEIDFVFSFEKVSGQIDLNYTGGNGASVPYDSDGDGVDDSSYDSAGEVALEQAFITVPLGGGFSTTAGKFLSYIGFEAAEPTGMYQYSWAYGGLVPGYHNGFTLDYSNDMVGFGAAMLDSLYASDGALDSDYGAELMAKLTPVEGLTIFVAYGVDKALDTNEVFNVWASYEINNVLVAAEYVYGEKTNQTLIMTNIGIGDSSAVTLRASIDDAPANTAKKLTISPSHVWSDNLASLIEVTYTDNDQMDDEMLYAFETTFTF